MGRELPKPDPLAPPLGIGCDLGDLEESPPSQILTPPAEPSEEEGDKGGEKTAE